MSYQEMMPEVGKIEIVAELIGQDIMGMALNAPLTSYKVDVILFIICIHFLIVSRPACNCY